MNESFHDSLTRLNLVELTARVRQASIFRVILLSLLLCSVTPVVHADLLADFEASANYAAKNPGGGCRSIPYSDYRSGCENKQQAVERWCKSGEAYSCKGADSKRD